MFETLGSMSGWVILAIALFTIFGCSARLVSGSMPIRIQARADKAPYNILRITMHGRCKDTEGSSGLVVYRDLRLTFFYGPGPNQNTCNPTPNQQNQKISLVQGNPPSGSVTAVPGAVTAAGPVTAVAVGVGGSGYDPNNPPWVYVYDTAGGVTAPATVRATVSPAGVITGYAVVDGGGGYVGATSVAIVGPPNAGFQARVAGPIIATVMARDWINDGIFAQWIDTPTDLDLMCGSATLVGGGNLSTGPVAGGGGVVPAGGYTTPTGDGGIGALGDRLPLVDNVTWHKYTGIARRNFNGHSWRPTPVPVSFVTGDELNAVGKAAWNLVKTVPYQNISDGISTMVPIMVSASLSQLQVNPTTVWYAPLILPGTDPVRGITNPLVNNAIGESRRRKEKHALTF